MEKHIRLLAILSIVYGGLHLLGGLAGWLFIRWSGLIHSYVSGRMVGAFMIANTIIAVLLFFIVLISIASIIGGIGLLNRRRWARLLVLVLSFLNLIHFPLGTALGVYGIWVLMKDETDQLFPAGTGQITPQQSTTGN